MQYTIKKIGRGKYIVFFGEKPFTRLMSLHDARQWVMLQNGELEHGDISLTWRPGAK